MANAASSLGLASARRLMEKGPKDDIKPRGAGGRHATATEGKPSDVVHAWLSGPLEGGFSLPSKSALDFHYPADNTEFILCTDKVTNAYK